MSVGEPRSLPRWAVGLDVLAAIAFGTAAWIIATGGLAPTEFFGIRLSISRPGRAALVGALLVACRHFLVPRHPWIGPAWRALRRASEEEHNHRILAPAGPYAVVEFVSVSLGFMALVAIVTWPQARDVYGVPDLGDPLLSAWRLAWIAYQIVRDPANLFNANIFYPESLTLTYSDSILFPGSVGAPFLWMGAPLMAVYTYVFLGAWAFSGVATYYLVKGLTGRRDAAILAGTIFAIYPYRFEHYSHLEQQMTMWAPLVLLMLHRTIAGGRLRHGLATGVTYALQMYSCMYVALFLAAYMVPLAVTLWWIGGRSVRPLRSFAVGGVLAGLLMAPLAAQYIANKPMFGERDVGEVQYYSAQPSDYLKAHWRSERYAGWLDGGQPERELFPGFMVIGLLVVGFWPPWNAARLGYVLAGLLAFEASLGMNGVTFPVLRETIGAYRGLRVPARFSILVGLTAAVAAGYAATRVFERWPAWRKPALALLMAVVIFEMWPRLEFEEVWRRPPAIYAAVQNPPAVLAEFPISRHQGQTLLGFNYMYFSTFHWNRILDGNSGFFPPSWFEYVDRTADFPSRSSVDYLRSRGVQYIVVHGGFYGAMESVELIQRELAAMPGVERVAAARFNGGLSELYRLR